MINIKNEENEKLIINISNIDVKYKNTNDGEKSILYFIYDKNRYNYILCEHNKGKQINLENTLFKMCTKHSNRRNDYMQEDIQTENNDMCQNDISVIYQRENNSNLDSKSKMNKEQ